MLFTWTTLSAQPILLLRQHRTSDFLKHLPTVHCSSKVWKLCFFTASKTFLAFKAMFKKRNFSVPVLHYGKKENIGIEFNGVNWVSLGQLGLGQLGSAWVSLGQLGSAWVSLGQLGSAFNLAILNKNCFQFSFCVFREKTGVAKMHWKKSKSRVSSTFGIFKKKGQYNTNVSLSLLEMLILKLHLFFLFIRNAWINCQCTHGIF